LKTALSGKNWYLRWSEDARQTRKVYVYDEYSFYAKLPGYSAVGIWTWYLQPILINYLLSLPKGATSSTKYYKNVQAAITAMCTLHLQEFFSLQPLRNFVTVVKRFGRKHQKDD